MEIKGFVKSHKVAEVLYTAYKTQQNVVLWGPGGYGKSMMSLAFLKQIGARDNQIFIKSLSIGTTLDDLLGGVNIKALRETGQILYNLEYSIFSRPYLILEEAFDAPSRVLEGLKDTLTSGYVRNAHQIYKIRTKFIIVCTNRSKLELASDESSKALMERFPLSLKVEWESHTIEDYKELIKVVFKEDMNTTFEAILDYILKSIKEDETKRPPAPRTVVRAYKILKVSGINGLRYLDALPNIERAIDFLEDNIATLKEREILQKEFERIKEKYDKYKTNLEKLPLKIIKDYNTAARNYNERADRFNKKVNKKELYHVPLFEI